MELLVVISVMAIIGVLAFANYNSLGQDQNLKAAASDVQSYLRLAQANASSRIKCADDTTGSGADWIVSFETDQLTLNLLCQIPPAAPVLSAPPLVLTNNITIDSVNGCTNNFPVTVTFLPLLGGVVFADTGITCVSGPTLTVNLKDPSGNTISVILNKGGLIGIGNGGPTIPPSSPTPGPTSAPTVAPTPTPTPTPLPPSASYKRVFETSLTYDGNLGGLAGADSKCQTLADTSGRGGTWKAWLSDSATSVSSRFTHATVSYKLLNGTTIANDWNNLTSGTILAPINLTEILTT
ncbi:MAG: hypothetical protein CEO21_126, partial [Microgenomates group bacterium Gr01-1014_80]